MRLGFLLSVFLALPAYAQMDVQVQTGVSTSIETSVKTTSASAADMSPPTPDPATFSTVPTAVSDTSITMTCTTGSDASPPIQYRMNNTDQAGVATCDWQSSPTCTPTGLTPSMTYTFTCQMRDSVPNTGTATTTPLGATTSSSGGSLTAAFTARPIQGSTCLAPCAVHFDAIGLGYLDSTPYSVQQTDDTAYTREFHSMLFEWDFGDSGDSCGATWANSGMSKNYAIGGIAGHTYCTAANYTVTLKVTAPDGETDTANTVITVTDPDTQFTAAKTHCFANAAGTFQGCPLDPNNDGTCETAPTNNCTVTSDLDAALTGGGNNCNLDGEVDERCLFRQGDTFVADSQINGYDDNTTGFGLIDSFGSSTKPIWEMGNVEMDAGDQLTIANIDINNAGIIYLNERSGFPASAVAINNVTFYNVDLQYNNVAIWEFITTQPVSEVGRLHAFIEMNMVGGGTGDPGLWPSAKYVLFMGGTFDHNNGFTNGYTMRAMHLQHYLMQHVLFKGSGDHGDIWNLRAYDEFTGSPTAAEEGNRYNLFSDNTIEHLTTQDSWTTRVCVDSGCNCINGIGSCSNLPNEGKIVDVGNYIFERNLFRWSGGTPPGDKIGIFDLQGHDFTIRNNVVDLQSAIVSGDSEIVLCHAAGEPVKSAGGTASDQYNCSNNTIFSDSAFTGAWRVAQQNTGNGASGCTASCFARNNLHVFTDGAGMSLDATETGWTMTNNLLISDGTDPFVGTMPGPGLTGLDDFLISSPNATIIDAGYDYTETDFNVAVDAGGLCRSDGLMDIGAHEHGATSCP